MPPGSYGLPIRYYASPARPRRVRVCFEPFTGRARYLLRCYFSLLEYIAVFAGYLPERPRV